MLIIYIHKKELIWTFNPFSFVMQCIVEAFKRCKQSGAIKKGKSTEKFISPCCWTFVEHHHSCNGNYSCCASIFAVLSCLNPSLHNTSHTCKESLNLPLFVVFDSASATSARSFLSGGWVLDNEWKSSSGHKLASVRRSCLISTLSRCLLSRSFSLLSRDSVTLSGRLSLSEWKENLEIRFVDHQSSGGSEQLLFFFHGLPTFR